MNRRFFIQALAGSGAGLTLLESAAATTTYQENASVTWIVKGFTCATCAVGLQAILERRQGIARAVAAYPSGKVEIGFDSHVVAASEIKRLIEEAGFKVTGGTRGSSVAVNR
jgi:Cu+-exporting ATPase